MAKRRRTTNHARKAQRAVKSVKRQTVAVLHESLRTNPFEPMERMMQAFIPWLKPWVAMSPAPKLDVIDGDSSVVVRAEVPGVEKDRLEVEASDTYVTIKGKVEASGSREDQHFTIAETRRGVFERTVSLPSDVDSTKAKATFRDGVVEVMLPKVDRSRSHQVKL